MIHAYDKNYLSKAQNNLASMLDFAVYDLEEDLSLFYQKFLQSKICSQFERGGLLRYVFLQGYLLMKRFFCLSLIS